MKLILRWLILSVSVFVASRAISGIIIDPIWVSLIVGACLTLFNMFIKPIINILTLPINIITLGIFSLVINGAIFWYLSTFIDGFVVSSFYSAFVGSLIIFVVNWLLTKIFHSDN